MLRVLYSTFRRILKTKGRRPISLRTYLVLLVLAAVLPLVGFSAVMLWWGFEIQRATAERGIRETAHALSLAVDLEARRVRDVLETLAASPRLDLGDLRTFYELSLRAAQERKGSWIILFDLTGQQIINTRRPFGDSLPNTLREAKERPDPTNEGLPLGSSWTVKKVLETGEPVISDVFVGIVSKQPSLSVTVPVTRGGKVAYALEMAFTPAHLVALLREQGLPKDRLATILDRKGTIIARTLNPERFVGQPSGPEHIARVAQSEEGWDSRRTLEGAAVAYAFTRSKLTGWTTDVAVSQAVLYGPMRRSLWIMVFGITAVVLFGCLAALMLGRKIASPIAALASSADAIQRGEPVELQRSAVLEIRSLYTAVLQAGMTSRSAEAERERRVAAEAREAEAQSARQKILQSESRLKESEARLRAILDQLPVAVGIMDTDGRMVLSNPAMSRYVPAIIPPRDPERITHWRPFSPDGRPVPPLDWPGARALSGETVPGVDFLHTLNDGREVWTQVSAAPFRDQSEKIIGAIVVVEDIDARTRAEIALREADRRKDEFLAMLGHELRNPLGVIKTVVQLLRMHGPADPKLAEYRDIIESEVKQMARLLDDLLDVSRVARGLIRLKTEVCDLAAVVRQVVESRRPLLEETGLHLSMDLTEQVRVKGDTTRLTQVVGNLLDNANKFSDSGGRVTVRVTEEGRNTAVITVSDTGIGMEAEILEHVFEPFVQADKSLHRSRGGLGLGLALVKGLVELHGGDVRASSPGLGKGSEFTVRLPLADVPVRGTAREQISHGGATRSRRVLLIEDNLAAAQSLATFLSTCGHVVDMAFNGSDGVQAARRLHPEVVLCDLGLPGLDGYAVARALRQLRELKHVRLIAVTGYGQEVDRERALEAGFDEYLTKPVDLSRLERVLDGCDVRDRPACG